MKLYIDTSNNQEIVIRLDEWEFKTDARREKAQMLLSFIDEKLKELGKTIDDVNQIEIVTGPGSFTGLRVGMSVANAIGFTKNIIINGKNVRLNGPITPNYS